MSKLYLILIFLHLYFFSTSQSLQIEKLKGSINTIKNSELNFRYINDSTAIYTELSNEKSNLSYAVKKQDEWFKSRELNFFSNKKIANFCFENNNSGYFSICENAKSCKISYLENIRNIRKFNLLPKTINEKNYNNTNPFFVDHNNRKVLFFASDRKGGYGGLDIWFSFKNDDGTFSSPINAGPAINSEYDEITPFYDTSRELMYYSSNKNLSMGFDIYYSSGFLNKWESSKSYSEINSNYDETYFSVICDTVSYFSSSRDNCSDSISCCSDIYILKKAYNRDDKLNFSQKFELPINLYFHNDQPDCCTLDTTTNKDYYESYVDYYLLKNQYYDFDRNNQIISFFEDSLIKNFNKFNNLIDQIITLVRQGKGISITIEGYASPLFESLYNQSLSKRRISSVKNYIESYDSYVLQQFFENDQIDIKLMSFGEYNSTLEIPKNKDEAIYNIEYILERKVRIRSVEVF